MSDMVGLVLMRKRRMLTGDGSVLEGLVEKEEDVDQEEVEWTCRAEG